MTFRVSETVRIILYLLISWVTIESLLFSDAYRMGHGPVRRYLLRQESFPDARHTSFT